MDYDQTDIAARYDLGRAYLPHVLERWLDEIQASVAGLAVQRALDLGCGTGRYSGPLADRLGARVLAIDPSHKMLAQAARKPHARVRLSRASGERLPLRDRSVELVFLSMVLHHLRDPEAAARECARVLRPGGVVCLRAGTRERVSRYPYLPFFPGSESILLRMLVEARRVVEIFSSAGLALRRHSVVTHEVAPSWRAYATKLAHGADSGLAQLAPEERASGLEALRFASERSHAGPVREPVDFFVFGAGSADGADRSGPDR